MDKYRKRFNNGQYLTTEKSVWVCQASVSYWMFKKGHGVHQSHPISNLFYEHSVAPGWFADDLLRVGLSVQISDRLSLHTDLVGGHFSLSLQPSVTSDRYTSQFLISLQICIYVVYRYMYIYTYQISDISLKIYITPPKPKISHCHGSRQPPEVKAGPNGLN
jgi:hypothetical protein